MNNMHTNNGVNDIVLARWSDRFLAWLIDFIVITIVITIISVIIFLSLLLVYSDSFEKLVREGQSFVKLPNFIISSIAFFLYWFYFESTSGQSIGKRVLNIKTTNLEGGTAKRKDIAIESFGKSFLLPLDVILGLIFMNKKRQRLFSRISNTIVIKIKTKDSQIDTNRRYIKD